MKKIIVRGRHRLSGEIKISGSKNAVLPIIAASLLGSKGISIIREVPPLEDVRMINRVIKTLGAEIKFEAKRETLIVDATRIDLCEAPYEWVRKMRASFLVMGPLLARCGEAKIPLPGGCAIGTRPIDQHLKGFEAMGAEIELGQGFIMAKSNGKLKGAKIYLDVASVGATENIMMAASLAEGTTIIENAAKEPEVVDLANFINAMGGKVRGAGTGIIKIEGVEELAGCEHSVIPDRIEAGTYMIAAAITGGDVFIDGAIEDHLKPVISKLQEMGVTVWKEDTGLRVKVGKPLVSVDVKTLPYPGFPTDMQSQMMALLLVTNGTSIVTETVFENRFMHVEAFRSMNARIKVDGRSAVINGNAKLVGSKVCATDLRAGAALILAALAADHETEITGVHHIERGYLNIVEKLSQVGASIKIVDEVETQMVAEENKQQVAAVQPSWA